jgi:chemotaxis protein MotB
MRPEQPPKPRIIVKKAHGGGHHGGAWKVAYADFVTTMMALFIVLWIVGQNAGTREAVARYFKEPGAFNQKRSSTLVEGSAGILPDQLLVERSRAVDEERAHEDRALREAAEHFTEMLEEMGVLETLRSQIDIEMTPEGLRIELRERDGSPFFRLGSAAVVPEMKPILENLARVLRKLPNHITVEGHTDSRQYSRRDDYSNWELSTDRTNAARRIMEAAGLAPGRIDRVVGHADRLPVVPDDRLNAANRRITIIVRRDRPA